MDEYSTDASCSDCDGLAVDRERGDLHRVRRREGACQSIKQSINKSIQAAILNPENAIKSGAKLLGNSVKLLDDGAGKTVEGAQKAVKNVLGIFKK